MINIQLFSQILDTVGARHIGWALTVLGNHLCLVSKGPNPAVNIGAVNTQTICNFVAAVFLFGDQLDRVLLDFFSVTLAFVAFVHASISFNGRYRDLRRQQGYANPVKTGLQYLEYLKDHPESTYDDIAGIFGVSKARVCQMLALCNRLPDQITDYLVNTDEPDILKHFTERRLRPLTLMASADKKFADSMR